jgi:hypothetical protein
VTECKEIRPVLVKAAIELVAWVARLLYAGSDSSRILLRILVQPMFLRVRRSSSLKMMWMSSMGNLSSSPAEEDLGRGLPSRAPSCGSDIFGYRSMVRLKDEFFHARLDIRSSSLIDSIFMGGWCVAFAETGLNRIFWCNYA